MKFNPTPEMITAATNVFVCMAFLETIRPIVQGYQKEILAKHRFSVRPEFAERRGAEGDGPELITDPKLSYLMPDDDFLIYDAECKAARKARGLHVENEDFCPLCVAEHELCKAQHLLVDVMEPVTHISADKLLCRFEEYGKYVELTLKLLSPFVENPLRKEVV